MIYEQWIQMRSLGKDRAVQIQDGILANSTIEITGREKETLKITRQKILDCHDNQVYKQWQSICSSKI